MGRQMDVASICLTEGTPGDHKYDISKSLVQSAMKAYNANPWFTPGEISRAFNALAHMLEPDKLSSWLGTYAIPLLTPSKRKIIRVIMAGNIPLAGFHDMVCVVLSGHVLEMKTSSQDAFLPRTVAEILAELPGSSSIRPYNRKNEQFDAIIATGSNNSARYFKAIADNKPSIIRRNRNSMAVLTGAESDHDLHMLAEDVFAYFGLGCRNVSLIMVPLDYDLSILASAWESYAHVKHHPKYRNNLLHNKALFQIKGEPFVDAGVCLFKESNELTPPLGVVHFMTYKHLSDTKRFYNSHHHDLQCVVGSSLVSEFIPPAIPFGTSQKPGLSDYADGVDTMAFLLSL